MIELWIKTRGRTIYKENLDCGNTVSDLRVHGAVVAIKIQYVIRVRVQAGASNSA